MQHRRIWAPMHNTGPLARALDQLSENLKHTNPFSIDTPQALLCAPVRSLIRNSELGHALQTFTSEGFLLENLQSNPTSTPIRTRKPDQVSEEVLASI